MLRYYIGPIIGDGVTVGPKGVERREAKFFSAMAGLSYSMQDYGHQDVAIVFLDITTTDHNLIVANADVIALPADIDQNLSAGAVTQTKNALESLNIPAGWVTPLLTFRQVLRTVARMFQYKNICRRVGLGKLFAGGVTLETQFSDLPLGTRQKLIEAAQVNNWDTSSLSGASKIRTILKTLADQWTEPIKMRGVTI